MAGDNAEGCKMVEELVIIQYSCTSCHKWVQRKCSGIKSSTYKLMKTFVCRGCMNPVTGRGCTSVDIDVNAILELVDKFCYLDDVEGRWRC